MNPLEMQIDGAVPPLERCSAKLGQSCPEESVICLPKGFRRVEDFEFLHGFAKKKRWKLQLLLNPNIGAHLLIKRPAFKCSHCGKPAVIIAVGVCRSILERNRSCKVKSIVSGIITHYYCHNNRNSVDFLPDRHRSPLNLLIL